MMQVKQALLLAFKDLRIFALDRGAMAFALGFPLVFIFAFSLILPDADQDETLELHVTSAEPAEGVSHQIIAGLAGIPDIEVTDLSPEDAASQFDNDDIGGYLFFPEDFSTNLQSGQHTAIQVVSDGESPQLDAFLRGVAGSIARDASIQQAAVLAAVALATESGQPPDAAAISAAMASDDSRSATVGIEHVQVGDIEPVPAASYVLPGYLTMFLFFAAGFGASELIKERTNNTFDRLIASGVSPNTLFAGKWLGTAARALMQAIVLWAVGLLFFNIGMGTDPLATVLVTLGMLIASASFALFLASVVKTTQAAESATVLAALTMAALGGSWWPLFIMPEWMQTLAKVTPHAWANEAFANLMIFGATLGDVAINIGVLLLFGLVFAVIAATRLNLRTA